MHVTSASNLERGNVRTDSDHSSNTGGNSGANVRTWNENDLPAPRPKLTILDVAALILNKQIGTGIFTTPGAVLLSTQSKGLSVALWTIGGFWTLMFLLIYLEFGDAFPYNGGELVYLDETYRKPELLATILFSGFFLMLANSYGNSIQFAKHVLVAAFPGLEDSTKLDPRLVRYIAISVITFVCLIHWHSSRAGLFLNKLVAWYKIVLLVVIFISGMTKSSGNQSKWSDSGNGVSTTDGMTGMVLIFYSYQGWENANYVAGEIRASANSTSKTTLNIGATLGVTTTWILYVLVTVAIYRVLGYEDLTGPHSDLAVALKFAPKVFGGATGLKVCMAISAFGNVLAVTYTASKVKQSIAIQRILPFWRYLQADQHTPKGALILHWITSVIFVAFAPSSSDGYSFAVGFYTYGHILFSVLVAVGLVKLKQRIRSSPEPEHSDWEYTFFRSKPLLYTVPVIFALGNVLILVFAGKTHKPGKIPRWWWPIVTFIILFTSALYWAGMRVLMVKTRAINPTTHEQKTIGDLVGLSVRVECKGDENLPPNIARDIDETLAAKVDGSQRRVIVETRGWLASLGNSFDDFRKMVSRYLF
ncbi:amino acid transporter [Macroventuria anomochaeta]|uniref:Amino acid transporter n=1 Tax=Macroventuria anomochaeta TaxID=301207 RepID=A0ACB6RR35_9PLEO|nr:amino acid transporter [Macroventuria anomochaeta]KAF2624273.1 amino acid transporter [Macroventuria anomochaeta]